MRIARAAVVMAAAGSLLIGLNAPATAGSSTQRVSLTAHISNTGVAAVTVRWSGIPVGQQIDVNLDGAANQPFNAATAKGSTTVYWRGSQQVTPKTTITFNALTNYGATSDSKEIITSWTGYSPYTPSP